MQFFNDNLDKIDKLLIRLFESIIIFLSEPFFQARKDADGWNNLLHASHSAIINCFSIKFCLFEMSNKPTTSHFTLKNRLQNMKAFWIT